jgi:phosphatidylserine decarboxylase
MTVRSEILRVFEQEDLNFLLTNRIPRRLATQFVGWLSRVEQPLVRDLSIGLWRLFADLDLRDAKKTQFRSLHDCFIRELKDGARPIDAGSDILVSPCDAIVGACGTIAGTDLYQAKGFPYTLQDLLGEGDLVEAHRNGRYVTLRLTSSMYHRFHAPHDCRIDRVIYISGDTWNVNPIALKRVERVFCKNERAIIPAKLTAGGQPVTLVAVAAILVASIRLHCLDAVLNPPPPRAEFASLRRAIPQRRGARLVRARIDDHRLCAGSLFVVPECPRRRGDPRRRAADAVAVNAQLAAFCLGISASSFSFARSAAGRALTRCQYFWNAGRFSMVPNISPNPTCAPR